MTVRKKRVRVRRKIQVDFTKVKVRRKGDYRSIWKDKKPRTTHRRMPTLGSLFDRHWDSDDDDIPF